MGRLMSIVSMKLQTFAYPIANLVKAVKTATVLARAMDAQAGIAAKVVMMVGKRAHHVMAFVKHATHFAKCASQATIGVNSVSQGIIGLAHFASQDTTGVNTANQVTIGANFASQDTSIGHAKYVSHATAATQSARNAKLHASHAWVLAWSVNPVKDAKPHVNWLPNVLRALL